MPARDPRDRCPWDSGSRWTSTGSRTGIGSNTGGCSRRCSSCREITAGTGDAVDEAFARALERWPRVRTMDSPIGWTFTVARNLLRRAARSGRRVTFGRGHREPTPEIDMALWDTVRSLPKRERELIALRYVADLTEPEIATTLASPRDRRAWLHDAARTCTRCSPPRRTWHDRPRIRPGADRGARARATRRCRRRAACAAAPFAPASNAGRRGRRRRDRNRRRDRAPADEPGEATDPPEPVDRVGARHDARRIATRDHRPAVARPHEARASVQRGARSSRQLQPPIRLRPFVYGRTHTPKEPGAVVGRYPTSDGHDLVVYSTTNGVDAVVQYEHWALVVGWNHDRTNWSAFAHSLNAHELPTATS